MLTTFQADRQVIDALPAGASGFLVTDISPTDITTAVRLVASGEAVISPSVTRTLLSHSGDSRASRRRQAATVRLCGLTDREPEVADAVSAGHPNAVIAARLFLSGATVKAHASPLRTKLGVANRVQVAIVVHDADQDSLP